MSQLGASSYPNPNRRMTRVRTRVNFFLFTSKFWRAWPLLLLLGTSRGEAPPAELKLEAQLIWVTDHEQTPNSKFKPAESAIAQRLGHSPFRWKHFYEINRKI